MEIKNKIKPNKELYGDFSDKLIPLNLDAVQQRIDFFKDQIKIACDIYDMNLLNDSCKNRDFWIGIKREHCEVEV